MRHVRLWLTRLHRWTGLALFVFLVVVGFTGALLPFQGDIQNWLAPTPHYIVRAPAPEVRPLDWLTLRRIAIARSGGTVDSMGLHREPTQPAVIAVAPREGQKPLGYDALVLDPYTGRVLGREGGGSPPFVARIMPFLYDLHTNLAVGAWGVWLLGIAALFWTLDCFVGFYLTLPAAPRGWWRHWRTAWKVRLPPRSSIRLNFDLHRAAGLWLWPLLFVFAWSSVGMNLRTVYDPVMATLTDYEAWREPAAPPVSREPLPDFEAALALARRAIAAEGQRHGFIVERERDVSLDRKAGTIWYVVRTSRDRADPRFANSYFTLNARTGRILSANLPTGEHNGNTIDYWLGILHVAGIGGLPYRILVSVTGAVIVLLSITGVVIWVRKSKARAFRSRRRPLLVDQSMVRSVE